jgi:ferritin-like metal-binding protein YciE
VREADYQGSPQDRPGRRLIGVKAAVQEHLEVTKGQVTRIEEVFSQLQEKPKAKHCKAWKAC